MNPLKVRRANSADMQTIGRLGALLVAAHHSFDSKRFIPAGENTAEGYGSYIEGQLDNPQAIILVAEIDGVIAGYSYSGMEGHDWMELRGPAGVVYDIIIDPDHRKQGMGRALLEATLSALKEAGASQVVLAAAQNNQGAQRLFEQAGFRRTMIEMTREL